MRRVCVVRKCIASKESSSASIEGNYALGERQVQLVAMRQSSPSARVSLALENAHKTMHAATDDYYRRNTTSDSPPSMVAFLCARVMPLNSTLAHG